MNHLTLPFFLQVEVWFTSCQCIHAVCSEVPWGPCHREDLLKFVIIHYFMVIGTNSCETAKTFQKDILKLQ